MTEQIGCVCKSIKTTKLVQESTIACSSSAMLEHHGSTRSSRTRSTKSNVSSRIETSQVEFGPLTWPMAYTTFSHWLNV